MTEFPQYHFDRSDFVKVWEEVFEDKSFDIIDLCSLHATTTSFELWCDADEEYYIEYLPTGVTINWYKGDHLGRTNTCTDPNFTLEDFKKFLTQLKEELSMESQTDMIEAGALVKFKSKEELTKIRYSGSFCDLADVFANRIALVTDVWKRGPEGLDRKYEVYFPDKAETRCWFEEDEFTVLEEDIFAKYRKEIG